MEIKCQHCGFEDEFYSKNNFRATEHEVYDNRGRFIETWDSEKDYTYYGEIIYCGNCNKRVMRKDELK